MSKKAQVTIFIIIALVIVISFFLLFFLKNKLSPEINKNQVEAPESVKPVQEFVEYSIKQSLIEALDNLGDHCGLVDPDTYTVTNLDNPTESAVLKPFSLSKRICPYWYYMSSHNSCESNCKFSSLMPPLVSNSMTKDYSIEAQINRYVKKKLSHLDFKDFKFQNYNIKKNGEINVTTTIGKDIKVHVVFPLKIEKNSKEFQLQNFDVKIPFNLQRLYRIAAKITYEEKQKRFLENFVLSLISVYSGIDKDKLPPLQRQVDFMNSPVFWQITDVKNQLRQKVLDKIPSIQVYGSKNFHNDSLVPGAVLYFPGEDLSDVEVYFTFPDTRPFYLAMNGMSEGLIGPNTIVKKLGFMQFKMNDYLIGYDLSFPVLVTIRSSNKITDKPYELQFALEGNIRNSQPMYEGVNISGTTEETMFCDSNQRVVQSTIKTINSNGHPVGKADIFYKCGDSGCYVGTTDDNGLLKTKLPICVNGIIVADKNGYAGEPKRITTLKDKKVSIEMRLSKIKEFSIDARKLVFEKEDTPKGKEWAYRVYSNYKPDISSLGENETLIITFKSISSDYETMAQVKPYETGKVMLVPGKYEVTAQLIKHSKLVIKATSGLFGKTNGTVLETAQSGGFMFNARTGYFDLTRSEFEDSDSITFYTLYFDLFSLSDVKPKDLAVNNDIETLSERYRKMLEPIIR